jgi:hypothetical protein
MQGRVLGRGFVARDTWLLLFWGGDTVVSGWFCFILRKLA